MPLIEFDPDGELDLECSIRGGYRGGGLKGAKRCEYFNLCKQLMSGDSTVDYKRVRDSILEFMKEDVVEYVNTLPEEDREYLFHVLNIIFSNSNIASTNYIQTINIIGIQITILFTQYEIKKKEIHIKSRIFDLFHSSKNQYEQRKYEIIYLLKNNKWMNYNYLLDYYLNKKQSYYSLVLLSNNFLLITTFLTLDEIIDSFLNGISYVTIVYKSTLIDGYKYFPYESIYHDMNHFIEYLKKCNKFKLKLNTIQNFRNFVKNTKDRETLYSINLIIFLLIHEGVECRFFSKNNTTLNTNYVNIFSYLYGDLPRLINLDDLGKSIPKAYRVLKEGQEKTLDEAKVKNYLSVATNNWRTCYKEFSDVESEAEAVEGGRRRTRRVKRNLRKRKVLSRKR